MYGTVSKSAPYLWREISYQTWISVLTIEKFEAWRLEQLSRGGHCDKIVSVETLRCWSEGTSAMQGWWPLTRDNVEG